MQTFKKDYAKNRTEFSAEFERKRALLMIELQRAVQAKGWLSRVLHAIAKKPFLAWN